VYANRRLGAFTDVLSDIVTAGRDIFVSSRTPVYPSMTIPTLPDYQTPPFIDPQTGQYLPTQPATDYTMPIMIGAGALVLLMLSRRRRG